MTEEEKKAIVIFKKVVEFIERWNEDVTVIPEDKQYYQTILNLLEKQQKQIEELEREKNNFHNLYCKDHIKVALQEKEIEDLNAKVKNAWEKYDLLLDEHSSFYNYFEGGH